jgi:hypothetical protein
MKKIILTVLVATFAISIFSGCGYSRKSNCPAQDSLKRP